MHPHREKIYAGLAVQSCQGCTVSEACGLVNKIGMK